MMAVVAARFDECVSVQVMLELSPAEKRQKHDQRGNKTLQDTDRPGQGWRSESPGDFDVAAVDIVHESLQTLSDSRPTQVGSPSHEGDTWHRGFYFDQMFLAGSGSQSSCPSSW